MNVQEAFQLLSLASARDGRQVDQATAMVWADDLTHVSYAEALEGVRMHFRESTEWLKPAHVVANVRRVRDQYAVEARKDRQIEARRQDDEWRAGESSRDRVWRAMLADPSESERTKAWIREQLA